MSADPRAAGDRIASLLEEIRSVSDARVAERAEELVRSLMELYGAGLEGLLRVASAAPQPGDRLADRIADDALVSSLLALHGLHPIPVEDRVRRGIERVRPYLGSHGGDVELVAVEDGVALLRLAGSCDGCPSSALTVKNAIEGAIEEAAPEIVEIRVEDRRSGAGDVGDAGASGASSAEGAPLLGLGRPGGANGESRPPPEPARRPRWVSIETALAVGEIAGITVHEATLFLCRLETGLYAYLDRCPACASSFAGAQPDVHAIACPTCGHRFDLKRAGRSLEAGSPLHLEPLPLLEDRDGVRVAAASPEHSRDAGAAANATAPPTRSRPCPTHRATGASASAGPPAAAS